MDRLSIYILATIFSIYSLHTLDGMESWGISNFGEQENFWLQVVVFYLATLLIAIGFGKLIYFVATIVLIIMDIVFMNAGFSNAVTAMLGAYIWPVGLTAIQGMILFRSPKFSFAHLLVFIWSITWLIWYYLDIAAPEYMEAAGSVFEWYDLFLPVGIILTLALDKRKPNDHGNSDLIDT